MKIGNGQGSLIAAIIIMAATACVLVAAAPSAAADAGAEPQDLVVDGSMTFDADLECRTLTVNKGTLTVNGSLKSGDTSVAEGAKIIVKGDAETGILSIAGAAVFKGSLSTGDFSIEGYVLVDGDVSSENISVDGLLRVGGVLSSKNLTTGDRVIVIQPGKLYAIDVRGTLDVYKDLIYQDTRASGDVTIGGRHRYGDITVRHYFAVEGEVSASDIAVEDGAVATVGRNVTADSLRVSNGGELTIGGDLESAGAETLGAEAEHALDIMGTLSVKGSLTFGRAVVGGALSVAGDLDVESIRVNGSLDVDGKTDAGVFVAEQGQEISGDIAAERMIVPEGASFAYGWNLDAKELLVLGTFRAGLPFSAERVFVGMYETSDDPFVGGSAVLEIPEGSSIMGLKALYVAEGSAVEGLAGSMESTTYIVDGAAYATAYMPSGGSLKVSDLRVPAFNGTVASGWKYVLGGEEAPVGDMLVGGAGEVRAGLCAATVWADEGFAKVFIDKAEVPIGEPVRISPGAHTLAWTLADGRSGEDVVAMLGDAAVSGGSFVIADGEGECTISVFYAMAPSEDGGSSSGILPVAGVLVIILAAVLIGCRTARSRSG